MIKPKIYKQVNPSRARPQPRKKFAEFFHRSETQQTHEEVYFITVYCYEQKLLF